MKCTDTLDIIDADGLVDIGAARREAALTHIAGCADCREALAVSKLIGTHLDAPAAVSAPPALRPTVLARIARLDMPDAGRQTVPGRSPRLGWVESIAMLCVAVGLAVVAFAATSELVISRAGILPEPVAALVRTSPPIVVAAGLTCYVIGLVVPVTRRWQAWRSRH